MSRYAAELADLVDHEPERIEDYPAWWADSRWAAILSDGDDDDIEAYREINHGILMRFPPTKPPEKKKRVVRKR